MARLHEYQGKELLKEFNIPVPYGKLCSTPEEVKSAVKEIGKPVVLKAQVWTTGRAGIGGIKFANSPEEGEKLSKGIFGLNVKNFSVEKILVEEKLQINQEFYTGIIIDDNLKAPVMIFSSKGGTGIEEIARKYPDKVVKKSIDIVEGLKDYEARNIIRKTGISGSLQMKISGILVKLFQVAKKYEARAAEINPLIVDDNGKIFAADCRITVDDYAVFRHKELGIEIAREFDRPPGELDKIAYRVEEKDYRGTFYFIQLNSGFKKGEGFIGFHGAGGGGSMMSMDAITRKGYKLANFADTSGNPPASKVYKAAKIILSQKGIDGYFGSGSGVASQEQFHSARGLVKAFREENISIPVVIRLGGNQEDKAVEILENYTKDLPAPVEGYKKDDSADFCAERLDKLIKETEIKKTEKIERAPAREPYTFETMTGYVEFDHYLCKDCDSKICIKECIPQILKLENGVPVLAITREEAKKGRCIECLACEIECEFHGNKGGYTVFPIEGLDEYRAGNR
ncbi:succinyl-CoA synthetase subunit beta [candidate division KSB1 bacterium]|nr:MAG: succinyl-CoA synthetase subunit beta [candidate division KSB1 bacterium]